MTQVRGLLQPLVTPTSSKQSIAFFVMERFQKKYKLGYAYDRVYYAWDSELLCDVALKRYKLEDRDEGLPCGAIREMSLLKSLSHPNVIRYAVRVPH